MNCLVVNLLLPSPCEGSLVTVLRCASRAPGMAENDRYSSVLHFNQPKKWRGWQELLIPAVNLVPTGFPDGWKRVSSLEFDVHSREGKGSVVFGDIQLRQVEAPDGPRMTDEELLGELDLDRADLAGVKDAVEKGRQEEAIEAYTQYLRRESRLPASPTKPYPHYTASSADEICDHIILQQHLPKEIDWHCNPIGYLEWNHAFNRHTWMGTLAEAWERTGDPKYARELDSLIRSWIRQNPEPVGHNGGLDPAWETLSTACRINWSWPQVLRAAQKSADFSDRTLVDMAKMWHGHARHLMNYHGHNNWFVAESAAILTVACAFPEFRRSSLWLKTAMRRLEGEMRRQVFPDGVQCELSPGYHAMCADLFSLAQHRAAFRGHVFSRTFTERLAKMFDYLAFICRPDGTYPVPNDSGCCLVKGNEVLAREGRRREELTGCGREPLARKGRLPRAGACTSLTRAMR